VKESIMKISVIIPAYNAERYIAKAIESCLSQTYAPHEIIVVDDGSTDGTAEVAESFPSPVRVIRLLENMGAAVARNRGVQASTGDWLNFLDADDWFLPQKFELQHRCALENEQAVLIYAGFRVMNYDKSEYDGKLLQPRELFPRLRYRCVIHLTTVALRRAAFDAVGGFNPALRVTEDWDLWLRLADRYTVALFVPMTEQLVVYRKVAGSLSSNTMRFFYERPVIYRSSCLTGTSGISRFFLQLRLLAFNYYDTAESLRDDGSHSYLTFMLKSFVLWPFPCFAMPNRYKVAIVMALQTYRKRVSV
jgi:glycosyltransferase involved in cell wall biosynthesis